MTPEINIQNIKKAFDIVYKNKGCKSYSKYEEAKEFIINANLPPKEYENIINKFSEILLI